MRRLKQKDINFFLSVKKKKTVDHSRSKTALMVLLPIVLVAAFALQWLSYQTKMTAMQEELDILSLKTSMIENGEDYTTGQKMKQVTQAKQLYFENLLITTTCAKTYPHIGIAFFNDVYECANDETRVDSIVYKGTEKNEMVIHGTSETYTGAQNFAEKLRNAGWFSDVNYYGWVNKNAEANDKDDAFEYAVYLTLSPTHLNKEEQALIEQCYYGAQQEEENNAENGGDTAETEETDE